MYTGSLVDEINDSIDFLLDENYLSHQHLLTDTRCFSVWRSLIYKHPELAFLEEEDDYGFTFTFDCSVALSQLELTELKRVQRWRQRAREILVQHPSLRLDSLAVDNVASLHVKPTGACGAQESWKKAAVGKNFDPFNKEHINSIIRAQREDFYRHKGWLNEAPARHDQSSISAHRRSWMLMVKKEIPKAHRLFVQQRKELLMCARRCARECMRSVRQKHASCSVKLGREAVQRAKRLAREVGSHWRQFQLVEKAYKRKAERHLLEQRKADLELLEAKRQQRKLNFLLTQTELYAHFMARKLSSTANDTTLNQTEAESAQMRILDRLKEEVTPGSIEIRTTDLPQEQYDVEQMKEKALRNVEHALASQKALVQQMDRGLEEVVVAQPSSSADSNCELSQPALFQGQLKQYQLRGMNWLLSLYDQGINGILADEMGLGKTIMTMAFLGILAERYGIWGPFLVIAPASTLHNWSQEFQRFMPDFKVIPYWGSPSERRILRRYWNSTALHSQECSFHVVVTSYQVVLQDVKMVGRIAWQYLVLDEAQAIKSTSSQRWNTLLKFRCRNRLLLTGTPIQNSMQELWALLHFIMPTLFDNHDEFSEWFSKDIESGAAGAADGATGASGKRGFAAVDESQLTRLHLILKPFMLRRVKADVEHELAEKIEVLYKCPMSRRQQLLYAAVKSKISLDELADASMPGFGNSSGGGETAPLRTHSLMNLVMQLRKVCNHPDLLEWRDVRSSFFWTPTVFYVPRLLLPWSGARRLICEPWREHLLLHRLSPHAPHNRQTFNDEWSGALRVANVTSGQVHRLIVGAEPQLLQHLLEQGPPWESLAGTSRLQFCLTPKLYPCAQRFDSVISKFLFVRPGEPLLAAERFAPRFIYDSIIVRVSCAPRTFYCPMLSCARWHLMMLAAAAEQLALCPMTQWLALRNSSFKAIKPPFGKLGPLPTQTSLPLARSTLDLVDMRSRIADSGKLHALDDLLQRLAAGKHRVLIYSQMTKMIDILEAFMTYRGYGYIRLDGSSRISDRRDLVSDFQTRTDLFAFLLSTRAGGIGINLTAADTVIFYDSDWNPTVDQQAMDRAHRLGQTRQVTVYRLICSGSVEERILQRAAEKSRIQRIVITGARSLALPESDGSSTLKPQEMVSLLLDDEEMETRLEAKRSARREERIRRAQESAAELHVIKAQIASESALDRRRRAQWAAVRGRGGGGPKRHHMEMIGAPLSQPIENNSVSSSSSDSDSGSASSDSATSGRNSAAEEMEESVSLAPSLPGLKRARRGAASSGQQSKRRNLGGGGGQTLSASAGIKEEKTAGTTDASSSSLRVRISKRKTVGQANFRSSFQQDFEYF